MSVALLAMQATMPFKIKALGGDLGAVGVFFMWASLFYVVAGVGLGWISHRLGPRRVMLVTLTICALMSAGMIAAHTMWQLYALQIVYSVSLCVFWAATEHASTGLHARLSLIESTSIFCVAFSTGNVVGLMVSSTLQGQTMIVPFLVSVALTLAVFALTWITVSAAAGTFVADAPSTLRHRLNRSLLASRTGLVGVYGIYALISLFLPRYLWEYRGFTKPLAGSVTAAMLVSMAVTFALHGRWEGWQHKLAFVRACPFVAALALLVVGATAQPVIIATGAILVGIAAGTAYTHNLYYSLEEPGMRARRAGIHEALVGAAFMIPPALSGLATRWTNNPASIFWVCAALAVTFGIAQNVALAVRRES